MYYAFRPYIPALYPFFHSVVLGSGFEMIKRVCIVFLPLRPGKAERFVHRLQGAEISTKRGTNSVSIFLESKLTSVLSVRLFFAVYRGVRGY